jgi:hypothetical protein
MNELAMLYAGVLPDVIFKRLKRLLEKGVDSEDIYWSIDISYDKADDENMHSKPYILRVPGGDSFLSDDYKIEQVDRIGVSFKRSLKKWIELIDTMETVKLRGRDVTVVNAGKVEELKKFLEKKEIELNKML